MAVAVLLGEARRAAAQDQVTALRRRDPAARPPPGNPDGGAGAAGQPAGGGAEFIRELIIEGTREGLDAARGRGVRLGQQPAMTAEHIRHARDLLNRTDNTVSSIARLLGVSRATIYKYLPEVTTGRVAAALPPGGE